MGSADVAMAGVASDDIGESETRLRLALSSGDLAIWELDIEKLAVTPSPELNRLYGFPPDAQPTLAQYRSRYAPGELERVTQLQADVAAHGDTRFELEIKHIWPDGTVKWLLIRAEAAPPLRGSGPRMLGICIDVTGRRASEEALRRSEQRFRMSQQAAGIASLELDVPTGEVTGSDNFWALWGLSPRDSVHIGVLENIVLPEHGDIRSTPETRQAGTAEPKVEYKIRRPDTGEIRWLARHIEFTHDAAGRPAKMYGIMQDVTAQKVAAARQVLLTHELEHRIKNILSMVTAIASQTLRNSDLESARDAFMTRIRALSEAHNLLTRTRWTEASMAGVMQASLAAHEPAGRVTLSGPDLALNPKMALSLALAVNELATNAVKYGALSNGSGTVSVIWSSESDEDNGEAELVWAWRETGGPPVTPPAHRGFGSVLIERVLAMDFGGTVRLDYAPEGLRAELRVPMANFPAPAS